MSATAVFEPWIVHNESDWSVDTDSSCSYSHVGPEGKDPVAIVVVPSTWCDFGDELLEQRAHLIAASQELYEGALDAIEAFKLLRVGMAHDLAAVALIDAHIGELEYATRKATPTPQSSAA